MKQKQLEKRFIEKLIELMEDETKDWRLTDSNKDLYNEIFTNGLFDESVYELTSLGITKYGDMHITIFESCIKTMIVSTVIYRPSLDKAFQSKIVEAIEKREEEIENSIEEKLFQLYFKIYAKLIDKGMERLLGEKGL